MKKAINTFIILCGVALVGYVIVLASAKNSSNSTAPRPTPAVANNDTAGQVVRVKVAVMKAAPMNEYLLLPGTVEAWEDVDLSAKVGGNVEWVGPKEGDRITSGEVILRLDTAQRQALLKQAEATLAQAEKQYERISKLVGEGVGTRAELDNVVAARDVARANVEVARVALNDAVIRSPLDGVIDRIYVDRGEHLDPGRPVAKIVQTDRVKVVVNVPEKDVCFCQEGQMAGVFLGELRQDLMIPGKIFYVALTGDPINRTYPMRIEIPNKDRKLRPGMIVRVGLIRRRVENALAVPLYAVVDRGDRKVVFIEKDGRAVQREVSLGILEGDRIQVTQGLQEGDRLIVVGQRDLVDGAAVEVEEVIER
ncbi:MAG: efflux RND transporter periplasmic adaptor subunit [Candidatus Sumerlaeia bacterium]|nr:efflux RND transporter periplasmic adaptor subunit [Candidatus Sumerlaeia bacterium]